MQEEWNCTNCQKNNSIIHLLTKVGASIDERNSYGRTPLFTALENHNYCSVRALVKAGADINLPMSEKKETYLHWAILKNDPRMVKFLLQLGADVNRKDGYGLTPIQKAVVVGNIELLDLLSSNGADMSIKDSNGWSLLHCAARYGRNSVVAWLIENKFDVDAKSDNGKTPLHFAAQNGHNTVVHMLLDSGAKVNSKDEFGWTALRWANYRGHGSVVQLFNTKKDHKKNSFHDCALS